MRKLLVLLVFTFLGCHSGLKSGGYSKTYVDVLGNPVKTRVDTNVMVKDTFFLKRKTENGIVTHRLFIDQSKDSKYYDAIFGVGEDDYQNIQYYTKEMAKAGRVLNHVNIGDLATEWRPVFRFNGKYYLYHPDDMAGKGTMLVTDSTLMPYFFGDGYTPIALLSVAKKSAQLYVIKTAHYVAADTSCPSEVDIYILDKKTMLSVWEMKSKSGIEYRLMVPKATMRQFPIIVNTSTNKEDEYDFEKLDYAALIQGSL